MTNVDLFWIKFTKNSHIIYGGFIMLNLQHNIKDMSK